MARAIRLEGPEGARVLVSGSLRVELAPSTHDLLATESIRVGRDVLDIVRLGRVPEQADSNEALENATTETVVLRAGRRPTLLWQGRTAWHGDLGERIRDVLQLADRTGDGQPNLIVGHEQEGTGICGQGPALLAPEAYDPQSRRFRPVTLRRLAPLDEEQQAGVESPSEVPPVAPLLRLRSFSSSQGGTPPLALLDGNPTTGWTETHPGNGQWEFVTLALDGPVHALQLVPRQGGEGRGAPQGVWITGMNARYYVRFPAVAAGEAVRVTLPDPLLGACLSIVLDEGDGPHSGLAEIQAFGELDGGGGVEALVGRLSGDARGRAAAVDMLVRVGEGVVAPLMAAESAMTTVERRALVTVLSRIHTEAAQEALKTVLLAHPALGEAVVSGLASQGEAGRDRLGALVADAAVEDSAFMERALLELSRRAGPAAVEAVLSVWAKGKTSEGIRRSYGQAIRGLPANALREQLAAWLSEAAHGQAALLLEAVAGQSERVAFDDALARTVATWPSPDEPAEGAFASTFRFAQAVGTAVQAGHTLENEAVRTRLRELLTAEAWMLRAEALRSFSPAGDRAVFEAALADAYPRVRRAAVAALAGVEWARRPVAVTLRDDRWAMVRSAAVETLATHPRDAEAVVLHGLADDHERVRATAATTARAISPSSALDGAFQTRLDDEDEWPLVHGEIVTYAQQRCARALAPGLRGLVERAARPGAWEPSVEVAVRALGVLLSFGGDDAEAAVEIARRAPGALSVAAEGAANAQPCQAP